MIGNKMNLEKFCYTLGFLFMELLGIILIFKINDLSFGSIFILIGFLLLYARLVIKEDIDKIEDIEDE